MDLVDEIAMMGEINKEKHGKYMETMVPMLIERAEGYCNNTFDYDKPPAGVKIFIAESIKHKLKSAGLSGRSMGSVSYSYDTDLPEKLLKSLKPYRKLVF